MTDRLKMVGPEQIRTRGPDSFSDFEKRLIEQKMRSSVGSSDISIVELIFRAMWLHTERPRVYKTSSRALNGEPFWFNAFYKPEDANVIGFVHSSVGNIFQNDELRLSKFQRPDSVEEATDRELLSLMDELNGTCRQRTFASRNLAIHPSQFGVTDSAVAEMWHVQLHFDGHPGPQNLFNAVRAIQNQIKL